MKKGISMMSLIMYIMVLTIVITVIAAYNANILGDTNDFVKNTKMYEQYSKFNMFFLQALGDSPDIEIVSESVIVIYTSQGSSMVEFDSSNHVIKYVTDGKIINICEFVDEAEFTAVDNTLKLSMKLRIDDTVYIPQDISYAIGGWEE